MATKTCDALIVMIVICDCTSTVVSSAARVGSGATAVNTASREIADEKILLIR